MGLGGHRDAGFQLARVTSNAPGAARLYPGRYHRLAHGPDLMSVADVAAAALVPHGQASWWRICSSGWCSLRCPCSSWGLTGNPNLFPTVALLGNFLVPVSYVAFFYERRP